MRCKSKIMIVSLILVSFTICNDRSFGGQLDQQQSGTFETTELTVFGTPVDRKVLDSLSGGQNISIDTIDILANNMKLSGDMKDNLLYSTNTGMNQVSNDAFSSASGISTVVQNSGNQVIINNALILNLRMQ